jgi:hypothetical protein
MSSTDISGFDKVNVFRDKPGPITEPRINFEDFLARLRDTPNKRLERPETQVSAHFWAMVAEVGIRQKARQNLPLFVLRLV